MDLFGVFNKKIADQLILKGFNVVIIKSNKAMPRFNVYYFEATDEFRAAFYMEQLIHINNKASAN